uniref:Uncharacterized protein n=1 Tax=Arundo donax TaxID=35708 RepID=A0A0A8ZAE1_ARUDO
MVLYYTAARNNLPYCKLLYGVSTINMTISALFPHPRHSYLYSSASNHPPTKQNYLSVGYACMVCE